MDEYKPCWSFSYTKARYKDAQKALDNGAVLTKRDIVEHWVGNITIQIMEHDIRTLKLLLALLHNLNIDEVLKMDADDLVEYFQNEGLI